MNSREYLRSEQASYAPSAVTIAQLKDKQIHLGIVCGPFGSGKDGVIGRAVQLDQSVSRARGFTTRSPRPGETDERYDFRSDEERLLRQVADGALVQFVVAPFNDEVYGTSNRHLRPGTSGVLLIDTQASTIPQFEARPFCRITKVAVAPTVEDWRRMKRSRYKQHDAKEVADREVEALSLSSRGDSRCDASSGRTKSYQSYHW